MALYRETATGFIQEYASNPGAGYSAISAQPTDTVANRVSWWRTVDTYGQASAWHPSENRTAQDPREAQLSMVLSSSGALIAADSAGNVTDNYLGGTTTVAIYRGTTDVTISEGWTLSKTDSGCTSTLTESGGVYTCAITNIALLSTTTGYVRITATLTGSTTQTRDFKFLKVLAGQAGGTSSIMDLTNDNHTVPTDAAGNNGDFTGCSTTAYVYNGTTNDSANWTFNAVKTNLTCTEAASSRTQTVTAMSADVGYIDFTATRSGYPNKVARFTVSKSRQGASSTIYLIEPSVGAIAKSTAGAYTPASITFSSFYISGSTPRAAYSGRFIIATQATSGGAWTDRYTSAADESSKAYTVPASIVAIRCRLYLSGGTTTLVDEQSLPIVTDGAPGADAPLFNVTANSYVVSVSRTGGYSPTTIDLEAIISGYSGTTEWTASAPDVNGGAWGATFQTGDTYTWPVGMAANRPWIKFKATRGGGSDVLTIVRVEEGSDAITPVLSNEAHALPASTSGTVSDYTGSGTTIYVYNGSTLLTYDGVGTSTGTWKVTVDDTDITCGSLTDSGTYLTVGNHSAMSAISDTASITYTISGKTVNGTAFSRTRIQSFSKAKDGGPGESGIVITLSNQSHGVPTDLNGNNGNFTGCATTASIYEGTTDASASWTWSVIKSNVTCTEATSSRTQTVTALSADTGYVDFTATRSGRPTQTARFTVIKVPAGQDSLRRWLTTSVAAVAKTTAGAYNPTALTVNAWSALGSAARSAYSGRFLISTQATIGGAWTDRYTSTADESSKSYTVPASIVAIRTKLYLSGGTVTLLDEEIVPIVSDGATGPEGPGGRGSSQIVVSGTSWSDQAAWQGVVSQTGTNPVLSDLVTIADVNTAFASSKFYTGGGNGTTTWGTWVAATAYINGNLLVTGTIGANAIAAGAITTSKLSVGSVSEVNLASGTGRNVLPNSGPTLGNETDNWVVSANSTGLNFGVPGAGDDPWRPTYGASVYIQATGTPTAGTVVSLANSVAHPVAVGSRLEAQALVSCNRVNAQVVLTYYNSSGVAISSATGNLVTTQGSNGVLANWPITSLIDTVPAGSATVAYSVRATMTGGATPTLIISQAYLGRAGPNQTELTPWAPAGQSTQIDGNGIKTGTIKADRIQAGTLTAASGVFGQISATNITTGTLNAALITVNNLSASSINTGTLNCSNFTVSNLSASSINTGTLNGTNVSVTNLSATNITGGTLSVDRISAGSINGTKITTGGINTGNIAANAITTVVSSNFSGNVTNGTTLQVTSLALGAEAERKAVQIITTVSFHNPDGLQWMYKNSAGSYQVYPEGIDNYPRKMWIQIFRGVTAISDCYQMMPFNVQDGSASLSFIDTPGTGAYTYYIKISCYAYAGASYSYCSYDGNACVIEIKR